MIYYGAPDVGEYFNTKSFIDISQFPNFEVAVDYIRQVDQSETLYQQIRQQPHMTSSQASANRFNFQPLAQCLCTTIPQSRKVVPEKVLGEWTMVSAVFDIPTDTGIKGPSSNRSIDFYLQYRFVIELDVQLVLFCDPATYPKLWKLRSAAGLLHKTCFVTMHLRDFPLYSYRDRIAENRRKPPVYAADHRNTPDFFVLTASKFHMVKRAIEMNPFGSKYVCWCDYGIQHVGDGSQAKSASIQEAFQQRREKPSFCYISYLAPRISLDPFQMYSFGDGRCVIAAGFFTGKNEPMLKLCDQIDQEFRKVVELGRGHAEEQLLATVHARDPTAFEMFYGDYYELITNYVWVRSNPDAVLGLFIDRAAEDKNWTWILPACEKLYLSQYTHKTVQLNPTQIVRLFERYTQAATELKQEALVQKLLQHFHQVAGSCKPIMDVAQTRPYAKTQLVTRSHIGGAGASASGASGVVKRVLRSAARQPAQPPQLPPSPNPSTKSADIIESERIARLLNGPKVPVTEEEAVQLSTAAWSNIDAIVYINLDTRMDRASELLEQISRLRIPISKLHRFSAILAKPGAVGCSASHLQVLKMARDKKWKNVLVLEDDFNFIGDTRLVWQNIAAFFKKYGHQFDVAQLTSHCNDYVDCPDGDPIVKFARKASNASAYIVAKQFYDPLIARWESTLPLLKESGKDWLWINDQSWQALQTGNWFAFVPLLGYQRPSFSDLSNRQADPHGLIQPSRK